MAWRGPGYGLSHLARTAGASALSLSTGTAATGFPLSSLVDDSAATFFRSTAAGSLAIDLDPGASAPEGAPSAPDSASGGPSAGTSALALAPLVRSAGFEFPPRDPQALPGLKEATEARQ